MYSMLVCSFPCINCETMKNIMHMEMFKLKTSIFCFQDIQVIGEFEVVAMAIREQREFVHEHGGIVNSADPVGQRREEKETPMQRMVAMLQERGLRPHDLFRAFDKSGGNKQITQDEFIRRIKVGAAR